MVSLLYNKLIWSTWLLLFGQHCSFLSSGFFNRIRYIWLVSLSGVYPSVNSGYELSRKELNKSLYGKILLWQDQNSGLWLAEVYKWIRKANKISLKPMLSLKMNSGDCSICNITHFVAGLCSYFLAHYHQFLWFGLVELNKKRTVWLL